MGEALDRVRAAYAEDTTVALANVVQKVKGYMRHGPGGKLVDVRAYVRSLHSMTNEELEAEFERVSQTRDRIRAGLEPAPGFRAAQVLHEIRRRKMAIGRVKRDWSAPPLHG